MLALVSAGVYVASVTKFIDYNETQLRFSSPGKVYVSHANFSRTGSGWDVVVRWRFENEGRLPLTVAIFQFELYVDNRSDPRPWYDSAKLADEYYRPLSFNLDRLTGLPVEPRGFGERDWRFNVTSPEDVARIVRDPGDGPIHLVILGIRIVYYISDVDIRHVLNLPPVLEDV